MMNVTPWLPGMQYVGRTRKRILKAAAAAASGVAALRSLLDGKVNLDILDGEGMAGRRRRVFDSGTTFILFLLQVMGSLSCGAMVKHIQACLAARGAGIPSSSTSAYCQARERLDITLLTRIFDCLASFLLRSAPSGGMWRGLKVRAVDGTKLDLADTKANLKMYPKEPRRKRGGKPAKGGNSLPAPEKDRGGLLPKMNLVAVFDLFTGGVLAWERGSERVGEQTLWRKLLDRTVGAGVLALGDAYYCSYANFVEILRRGGHAAFMADSRPVFRGRGRGARDFTLRLPKPKAPAKGWSKAKWARLPDFIELRVVSVVVERRGFKPKTVRVTTTLLDKKAFPAEEILGMHRRRWDAELRFRDLKTAMGMDTLACKTPKMLDKELTAHMIALNLVRALSVDAARAQGEEPSSVSFASALAQCSEWIRMLAAGAFNRLPRKRLATLFMEALSRDIVRKRPGRAEPRAVKKRPKHFPPMKTARRNHPEHLSKAA